jgi:MFS family permease
VRAWPTGGLWRHADFLRLWGAQTISQFGSQISLVAIPLVAIVTLEASPFEVAALGAVEMLPFLLIALPAGVWVDRLPRKPILVLGDVGRALALSTIPAAYALDVLTIWQLYVAGFIVGIFTVFFDVAYQSYLPSLVTREQLVEGNSKLEISRSGAQLAGPGVGGLLVSAIGAPYAVLVDAVSFASSGGIVARIRRAEQFEPSVEERNMRRELIEGLRYLLGDARWRALSLYIATVNFFSSVAFSIFLVYAVRVLDWSPALIGVVFALGNVGWLIGAALASRVSARLGIGRTLVFGGVLSGGAFLLIPLAPADDAVPIVLTAMTLISFGVVLFNVTGLSLFQALTPQRILGRMNASRRWLVWGTIPLGNLVGGVLAATIGLRPTITVGAVGASLCCGFLLARPVRTIRRLPEPAEPTLLDELVELPLETQSAET